MQDAGSVELDAELERLDSALRQLKIQYDMFFNGAIPKPPQEQRGEIERLLRRYSNAPIRKYATRFRLSSIQSRFNTLSELWAKTLRSLEEGDRPVPAAAVDRGDREQIVAKCLVKDVLDEQETLKLLHRKFLDERRKAGDENAKLSFASFVKGVASQAGKLRDQSGCERVELRLVVHDKKVQIKARPGK